MTMAQMQKPMIDDPVGENLRLVYGMPGDEAGRGTPVPERMAILIEALRLRQSSLSDTLPRQAAPSRGRCG